MADNRIGLIPITVGTIASSSFELTCRLTREDAECRAKTVIAWPGRCSGWFGLVLLYFISPRSFSTAYLAKDQK